MDLYLALHILFDAALRPQDYSTVKLGYNEQIGTGRDRGLL